MRLMNEHESEVMRKAMINTDAKMAAHKQVAMQQPVQGPRVRKLGMKGTPNCRHLHAEVREDGREWTLHATKGWRSRRMK